MNHRLVRAICAAAVLSTSSAVVAQRLPLDDPNPPWKAELEKRTTPRGKDGKPILAAMWQRSEAGFTAEHGEFVSRVRGRNAEGGGVQAWKGRGDGSVSFINFER